MKNKKRVASSILKILQDGFSKHLFHVRDTKILLLVLSNISYHMKILKTTKSSSRPKVVSHFVMFIVYVFYFSFQSSEHIDGPVIVQPLQKSATPKTVAELQEHIGELRETVRQLQRSANVSLGRQLISFF